MILSVITASYLFNFGFPNINTAEPQEKKPNIIVIVGEGAGWPSTSVAMDGNMRNAKQPSALTPNLAKLAEQGMRMSAFYASCPRCTPSRASYFTGVSPAKLHMTYVSEGGRQRRGGATGVQEDVGDNTKLIPPSPNMELPPEILTTAGALKLANYSSAHFGKWHVGRKAPTLKGFDEDDGANTNAGPGNNRTPNPGEGKLITDRGLAFIEKCVKAGKPFYLHVDHYGGGSEAEVTSESYKLVSGLYSGLREKQLAQVGIVHDVDAQSGRIMAKLDELGISNNTYVLYTTDHGDSGGNANLPLSMGKGSVQEGGVRIPFIVRGPGIKPGSQSDVRAFGWDLTPTFTELAGVTTPKQVEGGSLLSVWRGGSNVSRPVMELVIHFPHYDLSNGGPASAIFDGNFKLIRSYETGKSYLYNLAVDSAERNDLANSKPEKVAELEKRLDAYLKSVEAQMPTINPNYKPGSDFGATKRTGGGGKGGSRGRNGGGKNGGTTGGDF